MPYSQASSGCEIWYEWLPPYSRHARREQHEDKILWWQEQRSSTHMHYLQSPARSPGVNKSENPMMYPAKKGILCSNSIGTGLKESASLFHLSQECDYQQGVKSHVFFFFQPPTNQFQRVEDEARDRQNSDGGRRFWYAAQISHWFSPWRLTKELSSFGPMRWARSKQRQHGLKWHYQALKGQWHS